MLGLNHLGLIIVVNVSVGPGLCTGSLSCILNMQQALPNKHTLILPGRTQQLVLPVIQNMKTGNDGTDCIEKQSAHSILPLPHTALIC